jgi:hypothetical protein
MKKLRLGAVAVALVITVAVMVSTFAVQGTWYGNLQRGQGDIAFRLAIHFSRSGNNGTLGVRGGEPRMLSSLHVHHHTIDFDLPADGRSYHLHGIVRDHVFNGTWTDDAGNEGTWQARQARH